MDENDLVREAERGRRAQGLLEDPILRDAITITQQRIFDDFAKTDPANVSELQRLRLKLQCHADMLREIHEVLRTGKLASHQLQESRSLFERMKRGIRA
jgi:hypothetical protein